MRDKQIEEMAKYCCHPCELMEDDGSCYRGYDYKTCLCAESAKALYNAGYRKKSDVALEVIGEVVSKAKAIFCPDCDYDVADIRYNLDWLEAELKKKYESEGEG